MVEIPSPEEVQERLPLPDSAAGTILAGRNAIRAIRAYDPRLFVVVGPCSIHIRRRCSTIPAFGDALPTKRDTLVLVMRVYASSRDLGWLEGVSSTIRDGRFFPHR
jgi:phospho-2-dehydro-3-deoxyheptonate aldolase